MSVLFVFKDRGSAVRFGATLRMRGMSASVVSTPPSLGKSCGLSVAVHRNYRTLAEQVLTETGLEATVHEYSY